MKTLNNALYNGVYFETRLKEAKESLRTETQPHRIKVLTQTIKDCTEKGKEYWPRVKKELGI